MWTNRDFDPQQGICPPYFGNESNRTPSAPPQVPVSARADIWAQFLPQGPMTQGLPSGAQTPLAHPLQPCLEVPFPARRELRALGAFAELACAWKENTTPPPPQMLFQLLLDES